MQDVVIVAATRTPTGNFHGALAPLPAVELGVVVVKALLEKSGILPDQVDEVIFGQVLSAGCGQNPARQTALHAGIGDHTCGDHQPGCGSGLKRCCRRCRRSAAAMRTL